VGTFRIDGPHNILSFAIYIVTAIVVSRLSSAVKEQAQEAEHRRVEVEKLYKFAKILIETPDSLEGTTTIAKRIVEIFRIEYCGIHVPDNHGRWKHVSLSSGDEISLPDAKLLHDATIDEMIDEYGKRVRYIVLQTPRGIVGVMAMRAENV
jgi:K+-sensing histidine kinase KdpD